MALKVGLTLPPHDQQYLERRGGIELMSHLRSAGPRAEYRSAAIDRAHDRYIAGDQAHANESELCGLGLIVLQRAYLAVEDLAGLIHAFGGPDPWHRLRSTTVPDLEAALSFVQEDVEAVLTQVFCLPTVGELRAELLREPDLALMLKVRAALARRWHAMLTRTVFVWSQAKSAKATMHGFPIVSGAELIGPPRAGILAEGFEHQELRRFAVALLTTSKSIHHAHTMKVPIALDPSAVQRCRQAGIAAARLYSEAARAHVHSTELCTRSLLDWGALKTLRPTELDALRRISEELNPPPSHRNDADDG